MGALRNPFRDEIPVSPQVLEEGTVADGSFAAGFVFLALCCCSVREPHLGSWASNIPDPASPLVFFPS